MGGIVASGISINCDRCKKKHEVPEEQEKFYKDFSEREDKDDPMFVLSMKDPETGEMTTIEHEYVCTKCSAAIMKAAQNLAEQDPTTKKKPGPKKKTDKAAEKKPAPTEKEASPKEDEKSTETSTDENDLFDED